MGMGGNVWIVDDDVVNIRGHLPSDNYAKVKYRRVRCLSNTLFKHIARKNIATYSKLLFSHRILHMYLF